jgi:hypothetical protein
LDGGGAFSKLAYHGLGALEHCVELALHVPVHLVVNALLGLGELALLFYCTYFIEVFEDDFELGGRRTRDVFGQLLRYFHKLVLAMLVGAGASAAAVNNNAAIAIAIAIAIHLSETIYCTIIILLFIFLR